MQTSKPSSEQSCLDCNHMMRCQWMLNYLIALALMAICLFWGRRKCCRSAQSQTVSRGGNKFFFCTQKHFFIYLLSNIKKFYRKQDLQKLQGRTSIQNENLGIKWDVFEVPNNRTGIFCYMHLFSKCAEWCMSENELKALSFMHTNALYFCAQRN